jgi:hypothetical protein
MRRTLHKNAQEKTNVLQKTQSTIACDTSNEDTLRQCKSLNGLSNKQPNHDWSIKVKIKIIFLIKKGRNLLGSTCKVN